MSNRDKDAWVAALDGVRMVGSSLGIMAAMVAMSVGRVGNQGCSGGWLGLTLYRWQ